MEEYESLNHTKMGMQVPRGLHPEMPTEDDLWRHQARAWACLPRAYGAQRESGRGRALDDRSRAHVAIDPAEVRGCERRRLHQGQERDAHRADVRRAEA